MRPFILLFAFSVPLAAAVPEELDLGGGVKLSLVEVPAGASQLGGDGTAEPAREVTLTRRFWMGVTPVTRGQFARFVAETRYRTEAERGASGGFGWEGGKLVQKKHYTWLSPGFAQTDEHPVVIVDFKDAQQFCAWLSGKTKRRFELPSEAQWEYAARAGGKPQAVAWHSGNSPGGTKPATDSEPNGFGLRDMLGNSWEWCEDWFGPTASLPLRDPLQRASTLSDKPRRVIRGGSFARPEAEAKAAFRFRNDPGSRNADNGFRVITLEPKPAIVAAPPPPAPKRVETPELERSETPGRINVVPAKPAEAVHTMHHDYNPGQKSGGIGVLGIGIGLAALGILVSVIRKVFSTSGGGASPLRQPPLPPPVRSRDGGPFQIRIMPDGFWAIAPIPRGTLVRARWRSGDSTKTRELRYEPATDGMFVFTGSQPSDVSVTLAGTSDGPIMPDVHFDAPSTTTRRSFNEERPSNFRGFPPAY